MIAAIDNIINKHENEFAEMCTRFDEKMKEIDLFAEEEKFINDRATVLRKQLYHTEERLGRVSSQKEILLKESENLLTMTMAKKEEIVKFRELLKTILNGADINVLFKDATEEEKKNFEGMVKDTGFKFDSQLQEK